MKIFCMVAGVLFEYSLYEAVERQKHSHRYVIVSQPVMDDKDRGIGSKIAATFQRGVLDDA